METSASMDGRFKKAIDILYLAKQQGIIITLNNDQLQLKLPENTNINNSTIEQIKVNKQLIIEYLSDSGWRSKTVSGNQKINKFDRNSVQHIPLSFSQERLWFIDQREGSLQYHSSDVLKLIGNVDKRALSLALQTIVNRHEVLRTVIREDKGETFQHIKAENNWQLNTEDGSRFQNDKDVLGKYIDGLINEPFDLSADDMMRVHLVSITDQEHLLVIVIHHIASDGWSRSVLMGELAELYAANLEERPANLKALELQYADYAFWQRQHLQGEQLDKKIAYWKQKLEDVAPLQLSTDYPRPAVQSSKGTSISFHIDKLISDELHQLNKEQGTTLYMTLLAAFKTLLYRYTGQQDICVGTSIADRPQEVEALIGFFVNTLALRTPVDGKASFIELLQQVRKTTLEAYENQEVPFEKVVESVVKDRDMSRHPLFQAMLVLSNTLEVPELKLGNITASREVVAHNSSKFDITFFITETPHGLEGTAAYSTDLFSEDTITKMIGHFKNLLSSLVKDPSQAVGKLTILSGEEEQQLLKEFNAVTIDYPKDKSVVSLFEEQVAKKPDTIAVVFENEQLTYRELNEKANQLAHYLQSKGVKQETLVPVCIDRSIQMIIGLMGILKAGAAYVPIDTEFPQERISSMLEDLENGIVVSTKENSAKFHAIQNVDVIGLDNDWSEISKQDITNPSMTPSAESLAYVIYTSGSTGKPKGVMIEHKSLVDYVFGLQQKIQVDKCNSFALVSSIATDLGNTVLYSSLIFGGTLHLFSKEAINDIDILHKYFKEHSIDCLKIVPSHWKALSSQEKFLLPAKLLIFGGEALHSDLVEDIQFSGAQCRVVNHYGPTETTVGKLLHVVTPGKKYNATIPIGKPFSNTQVYILSKELELCPAGVPGELYIGGDGLARGYVNQTDVSNTKFTQDPFSKTGNSLLYRTGDQVRYLKDGNIEFIGRIDEQVKIRGYRIELGEIESVLYQSGLVSSVAIIAKEDSSGNKRLVGYVVSKAFDHEEIVSYLRTRLPEYMIPVQWMELESMPLMANGKINRKVLPDPDDLERAKDQYTAPRNEMEIKLVDIWQELLEVEQVGIQDNFFELGGHSLLAIQLISVIRKRLEADVSIGDVFDYPTIESLALQLKNKSNKETSATLKPQLRPKYIPLSFNQERLSFIDQMEGSIQYHRPDVLRLKGEINNDALSYALKKIVNRHEVLRTVIREHDGIKYQHIKDIDNWRLTIVNDYKNKNNNEELKQYIDHLINRPFDLSKDDVLRAHLIPVTDKEHILVINIHHIASDGLSILIFVNELAEFYNSYIEKRSAELQPLQIQYADYAIWQRAYMQGELLDKKLSYWKSKLEGVLPLQLPTDYSRPAVLTSKGAIASFDIDKKLSDGLQQLSKAQGSTLFMIMLAAFKVLLYRYSGQSDICVGSASAGRQQQELERLIGFFVNTLALRSDVNGTESFTDFLQQIRTTTLEAYENQDTPFDKIVSTVITERDTSRSPLFQVMFDLGTAVHTSQLKLGQLEISTEHFENKTTKYDLTFSIAQGDDQLKGFITYSTDLYTEETIERMMGHYCELLSSIVKNPNQKIGKLPMLTQAEEHKLLVEFNDTAVDYPGDKTVIDLFEQQVIKTPDNIAVVFDKHKLTYTELNKRANQLAHYLRNKDVKEETLVPVCIERSPEMIIAVLAILKAGAAYVPIDPDYPVERIMYIIDDTRANIILSSKKSKVKLEQNKNCNVISLDEDHQAIEERSAENVEKILKPGNLAYIIYTSGSTGKPKGVMIEHGSLINYLLNTKTQYVDGDAAKSGTFIHLSYTFDASVTGMFMPLLSGKGLVVGSNDPVNIFEEDAFHNNGPYSFIKATPSHLELLLPNIIDINKGYLTRKLVIGGEALFMSHFDHLVQKEVNIEIINEYGPTEATVGCSTYRFHTLGNNEIKERVLIGKPIDNVQLYIIDPYNALAPIGVAGEICISGAGLARGYLNQPGLTAEKFIDHLFKDTGEKMYKTGDIGRWLPDGNLEYLGRRDDQVKIRGYRVELGEIESVLLQTNFVRQGVVLVKENSNGDKRLVAYVAPEGTMDREGIIADLKNKLPEYMIPDQWIEMKDLPITSNGKIDRKALPDPSALAESDQHVSPRTELESKLSEIWQQLLEVEEISINDNFFQLGGHSLLAIQLISIIRKELNIELTLKDVFQFSTINDLSKYIEIQTGTPNQEKDLKEFEVFNI